MKTIVEALQDLYVALGGKKADVSGLNLNPDVIEQIAALVNEGALNELPAVTIDDAGDVLTVNASGEWEAAAPSGGGLTLYGPYIATVSSTQTIPGNTAMDILLDSITDENETAINIYAAPEGTLFIVCGVSASSVNAEYRGFKSPYYYSNISGTMPPSISFNNKEESPVSVSDYTKITFLSSYELPAFAPPSE